MNPTDTLDLFAARNFTRAYQLHRDSHPAIREAACLAEQYPLLLKPIADHHLFAGRKVHRPLIAFSCELQFNQKLKVLTDIPPNVDPDTYDSQAGFSADISSVIHPKIRPEQKAAVIDSNDAYRRKHLGIGNSAYCHDHQRLLQLAGELPEGCEARQEIENIAAFWDVESTRSHYNQALTDDIKAGLGRTTGLDTRYTSGFLRQVCYSLDYDTLLQLGLPGMIARIETHRAEAAGDSEKQGLYTGMLMALDVLRSTLAHYERQALQLATETTNEQRQAQLLDMARALGSIRLQPPQTLREAIQLFWLYALHSDTVNYGRMDVYLGDFYCRDIDTGLLPEETALQLLASLWKMISEIKYEGGHGQPNTRIILGGRGRRNEAKANRFALAAMEVTRRCKFQQPSVTLRFYPGQDTALWDKAMECIGQNTIYPTLYNDEVHIPGVMQSHGASREDAEQYVPEGCGELLIDGMGFGSPNNILNFVSGLDLVLHNGFDTVTGQTRGLQLGHASSYATFEALVAALKKQIAFTYELLAKRHAIEHEIERKQAAFLFMSMLSKDCIARGKPLFAGGIRYLGGIIETFGLTNLADSLAAIKSTVFERKLFTLDQIVTMIDADFAGFERERRVLLQCPKYGNDEDYVDTLYQEINAFFNRTAQEAGQRHGLGFFLNCNVNPGGMYYSPFTKPSADGRRNGENMALGDSPSPGRDKNGLTALLNSLRKHEKFTHAGVSHNLKLNRSLFSKETLPKTEVLIKTYFEEGGSQLQITSVSADELRDAMEHPERYPHLLVRVSGFTAYFVELNRRYQMEIVNRTLYS